MASQEQTEKHGVTVVTLTVVLDSIGTRHNVASMTKDLVVALEELSAPLGILQINATAQAIEGGQNALEVLTQDDMELEG